jgi:hypothetical protein
MQTGDTRYDGEAEAVAAGIATATAVDARERLEDRFTLGLGNTPAIVFYLYQVLVVFLSHG